LTQGAWQGQVQKPLLIPRPHMSEMVARGNGEFSHAVPKHGAMT
jgi:hypothetical protein